MILLMIYVFRDYIIVVTKSHIRQTPGKIVLTTSFGKYYLLNIEQMLSELLIILYILYYVGFLR